MQVNITMLTHNRPELTRQAIESLFTNTDIGLFDLTVLDDASDWETQQLLADLCALYPLDLHYRESSLGTGMARNEVITRVPECNRGTHLLLSDNDVCFRPRWLETLLECYEWARAELGVIALGACCHPYNQPRTLHPFYSTHLGRVVEIGIVDALPLQSWLWRWEDWDRYGPFDQTPVGRVRMSEDFAVSQKIRADGGKVAAIYPPLIVNCGRTDSFGEPIPGAELIPDVEGVIVL